MSGLVSRRGAAVQAFLCVGMGHVYLGRPAIGWGLLAAMIVLFFANLVAWAHGGFGSPATWIAFALAFGLWLGQIVWATRLAGAGAGAPVARLARPPARARFLRSSLAFYIAAWLLSFGVGRGVMRPLLIEGFKMVGTAMAPTLLEGDYIWGAKLGSDHRNPRRGDVIVFRDHPDVGYDYVSRVVAVAGDVIETREGEVIVNGKAAARQPCPSDVLACFVETSTDGREYRTLRDFDRPSEDQPPLAVPPGHVFVLSDNRDHAADSRSFGPVPIDAIVGKAIRIWFSRARAGAVRWDRIGQDISP
jgi:signal peptidase I